jgi:hypothetical protein
MERLLPFLLCPQEKSPKEKYPISTLYSLLYTLYSTFSFDFL